MALSIFAILIMFLSFFTQIATSRLTPQNFMTNSFGTSSSKSKDGVEGTKWAVLVAGSRGFQNYRHQVCIFFDFFNFFSIQFNFPVYFHYYHYLISINFSDF